MIAASNPISSLRHTFETTVQVIPRDVVTIILEYLFTSVKLKDNVRATLLYFQATECENGKVTLGAWNESNGKIGEFVFQFFNASTSRENRAHFHWFYGLETRPFDTVPSVEGVRLLGNEPVWKPNPGNKLIIESESIERPFTSDDGHLAAHLTQAAMEWGNERGCENRILINVRKSYMESFWYFIGCRSMSEGVQFMTNIPMYLVHNEGIEYGSITGFRDGGQNGLMYLPPTAQEVNIVERYKKAAERFKSVTEERINEASLDKSGEEAFEALRPLFFDPEPPLNLSVSTPPKL